MKKIIQLILLLALALPTFAQNYPVSVSGQVTDTNGQPMQGLTVIVAVPGLNPNGYYYWNAINTNANGEYNHSFEISDNIPPTDLHIALLDCDSGLVSVVEELVPANANSFVDDFTWCAPQTGDCTATLTVDYLANGAAYLSGGVSGAAPLNFGFFPQDPAWTSLPAAGISQTVETSGLYCVYVQDADGCVNSACQYVQLLNPNTCNAHIAYDSIGNTTFLTAVAEGTASFTYVWSTGETTQSIEFSSWGTNPCVTVTDANGCVTSACLFNQVNCQVLIDANPAGGLIANASGTAPFSFLWNNGSTASSISPNAPGNYCVTLTDATGCNSYGCYWYGTSFDSCSVYIVNDSLNMGSGYFTAIADGTAPFTYSWNLGQTTQTIPLDPAYFGNYCVTVTDATGCESTNCIWGNNPCSVWILQEDSAGMTGLFAIPNIPAATYIWSNGSTDDVIFPTSSGTYCVTVTGGGCVASSCIYYYDGNWVDSCFANIVLDTISNNFLLTANSTGTAPFIYSWSFQNAITPSITVSEPGTYCVSITDAQGLVCVGCYYIAENTVFINEYCSGEYYAFIANTSAIFPSFLWNNGETTQSIHPFSEGDYCVTVTALNGTTSTACNYFDPLDFPYYFYTITGAVMKADSSQVYSFTGTAELYKFDETTNNFVLHETGPILSDPSSNYYPYYNFDSLEVGHYIVKILLDPNSPEYDDFLPTYYGNVLNWDDATIVQSPNCWWNRAIVMIEDQNLVNGDGQINGTVTEGDGLTANDEGNRDGAPLANASVLLFDENEQPITHTITDADGLYRFNNLPFGTYKLMVEIVGKEQVERWVTLNAQFPISNGNDFEVTENGIVLGLDELATGNSLVASPNPTSGLLNLWLDATTNFEATIRLSRLDGKTVLVENQQVVTGQQSIKLDMANIPTGLYLLQVTTGKGVATAKIVKQ
jgi:Carboxypeptidase regulatory-like domain/Secretion system C-terminal sorting domain